MKKFIAAVAVLSLVATPAFAEHRDNRWGVDSNRNSPYYGRQVGHERNERHEHRGVSTSGAVAIGIGALILGSIISSRNTEQRNPPQVVVAPPPQPQYVCQDVIKYDYYGNPYVTGRNCWYQY